MRIPTGNRCILYSLRVFLQRCGTYRGAHEEHAETCSWYQWIWYHPLALTQHRYKGEGRQLESRGENYWEQAAWRSNSSDQGDLAGKIWGKATSRPLPLWSPAGTFHWPKLPSSLGAGSMLMSPQPVQQPRQRPGRKGKIGGLEAHTKMQLKHFRVPKPSDNFKHPNFHKDTLTYSN